MKNLKEVRKNNKYAMILMGTKSTSHRPRHMWTSVA